MNIALIIFLSVIIEGIITYFRKLIVEKTVHWQIAFAMILGIFVSIGYDMDLPGLLGLSSSIPYLGNVLTGILISRGSNYIFDLVQSLSEISNHKGGAAH